MLNQVGNVEYQRLLDDLTPLVRELATRTVCDGEGATKFVTIEVGGGRTNEECLRVAYSIANSPLVKTAIFAGDPNWGRFCMSIDNAGLQQFEPYKESLYLDDICVARDGMIAEEYAESTAAAVMAQGEYCV